MQRKRTTTPIAVRFWAKVNRDGPPPPHLPHLGPCWLWTAATDPETGYGKFGISAEVGAKQAHRVSWVLTNGPIPDGLCVLHKCDIRACVRPEHLFLGTFQDNTLDMFAKGRGAVGDRHPARSRPGYLPRGDNHPARTRGGYLPRGEAHKNAKLTVGKVAEIKRRLAAGESGRSIAAAFGVSPSTILNIKRGTVWAYV